MGLPRFTRNRSFLGVMIGLPYLHSLWHPQSTVGAAISLFGIMPFYPNHL